jgi:hypothetical protein
MTPARGGESVMSNKTSPVVRLKGRPRGPSLFRERDLARAVRAAKRAGGVERVEIAPGGQINLILGNPPKAATANEAFNEWDEALGR